MTIADLRAQDLIVYEVLSGSRAYGLATPQSDTDVKGVFVLPRERFYGLDYVPQVADATNDTVFYELGRYVELLAAGNPNLLETLATPPRLVLRKHPSLDALTPGLFLSKRCRDTFAGYAQTQIRKAGGLNKKVHNPEPRERRSLLAFAHVLEVDGQGSRPLIDWLAERGWGQEELGLVSVPGAKGVYGVYRDAAGGARYRGVVRSEAANEVALSSVARGARPVAHVVVNLDGYRAHCKAHRQYWDWVARRNEARYAETQAHGRGYDAKNLMHTFRLLDMAREILAEGRVIVERPNREELLAIRRGAFAYEELMARADERLAAVDEAYAASALPEAPDRAAIERVLVGLREGFYLEERPYVPR